MYHLHLIKRRHLDERKTLTKVSTCKPLTNIPQNKSAHLGTRKPGKTYANSKATGRRSRHGRNQKKALCRANRQTPLSNPNKDVTVAGHTSMNQESLIQNSQAILQGLAEGGYIHAKTPKFESFFGDEKKNKLDFDMWERQVMSAATTHSGAAIKQAMMQSLKGQALMVTSALPPDASWEKLL